MHLNSLHHRWISKNSCDKNSFDDLLIIYFLLQVDQFETAIGYFESLYNKISISNPNCHYHFFVHKIDEGFLSSDKKSSNYVTNFAFFFLEPKKKSKFRIYIDKYN